MRNVGRGDMVTRVLATAVMVALVLLPLLRVHYSLLKLSLLVASELGLICLMLGIFFKAKTYFAGLQLFVFPLLMLGLINRRLPYLAITLGLAALVAGIHDIVTRRSLLNRLLGVNTYAGAA